MEIDKRGIEKLKLGLDDAVVKYEKVMRELLIFFNYNPVRVDSRKPVFHPSRII